MKKKTKKKLISILINDFTDCPCETFVPTGISLTNNLYILPLSVKIINESMVLVLNTIFVISS